MKNITLLSALMLIFSFNTFSQEIETVIFTSTSSSTDTPQALAKFTLPYRVRNIVDTTNLTFKEIIHFWESYRYDLFETSQNGNTKKVLNYWADSEIKEYTNPEFINGILGMYFMYPEYIMGIEKRNDTLYELRTVYFSDQSSTPEIMSGFSVFIARTPQGYKLYNSLTFTKPQLKNTRIGWLKFYYPEHYAFNKKEAEQLYKQANQIAAQWGLKNTLPVSYFIFPTYTEALETFGINIGDDFIAIKSVRECGRTLFNSRQIYYTKGGEQSLHEVLHILTCDLRGNTQCYYFDEGVCSYFGDHKDKYPVTVVKLKKFLNDNPQIDLGISLMGAYLDDNGRYTHDTIWKKPPYGIIQLYVDNGNINYMYIIMATICDIAYRKGGADLVKRMIIEAKDYDELYPVIEKNLGIKREDINTYIRDYLNANY